MDAGDGQVAESSPEPNVVPLQNTRSVQETDSVPVRVAHLGRKILQEHWLFGVVLLTGALAQGIVTLYLPTQMDEGEYLQGAMLVARGGFPMVTFAAREPLLMIYLALGVTVMGPSLLVARLQIVLTNLVTAGLLYTLCRRTISPDGKVIGILAAGAYLLTPFMMYYTTVVYEEPLGATFVALSLFFLLRDQWNPRTWNLPLAGIALALAILSRRSLVVVGLGFAVVAAVRVTPWRQRLWESARFLIPLVFTAGIVVLYVTLRTSISWTITELWTGNLAIGETSSPLPVRLEIFGYGAIVGSALMLVPIILLTRWGESLRTRLVLMGLCSIPVALGLAYYPTLAQWGVAENQFAMVVPLLFAVALFWMILMMSEFFVPRGHSPVASQGLFLGLLAWAALSELADFSARGEAFATYLPDMAAPLAVGFAWWARTLFVLPARTPQESLSLRQSPRVLRSRSTKVLFMVSAVGWSGVIVVSALAGYWVFGPTNPYNEPGLSNVTSHISIQRTYSPSMVAEVARFLETHFNSSDALFSFDEDFLAQAGHVNVPSISVDSGPYIHYLKVRGPLNGSPYPSAPPGLAPTIQQLLNVWNTTPLEGMVDGVHTQLALGYSELLAWYFHTQFHPIATFGNPRSSDEVVIYARGPPPLLLAQPLTTARNLSVPVDIAYDSLNGTAYVASLDSSNITVLRGDGSESTLTPKGIVGAQSVAWLGGNLWVGSSRTPYASIIPGGAGPAQVVEVGSGPSGFAEDPTTETVFVSLRTSGNVSAFRFDTQNGTWHEIWNVYVGPTLTGITVDTTDQDVYVASAGGNFVAALNGSNGHLISRFNFSFPPFSITYYAGQLLLTWWEGHIYRVSSATGAILSDVTFAPGLYSSYLEASSGILAVTSSSAGSVLFLNATNFLRLGTLAGVGCAQSVTFDLRRGIYLAADTCNGTVTLGRIPTPSHIVLDSVPGSTLLVGGVELSPGVTETLWPQVLTVNVNRSGFLPGVLVTTIPMGSINLTLTVPLGPTLASLNATVALYSWIVVDATVITLGGGYAGLFLVSRSRTR